MAGALRQDAQEFLALVLVFQLHYPPHGPETAVASFNACLVAHWPSHQALVGFSQNSGGCVLWGTLQACGTFRMTHARVFVPCIISDATPSGVMARPCGDRAGVARGAGLTGLLAVKQLTHVLNLRASDRIAGHLPFVREPVSRRGKAPRLLGVAPGDASKSRSTAHEVLGAHAGASGP